MKLVKSAKMNEIELAMMEWKHRYKLLSLLKKKNSYVF